jgi:lycopene beta-cyclase
MKELLLVGGGLANGLLALRLVSERPEIDFTLLEAGATLGGNHTWSFHGSDVSATQLAWLAPLCVQRWQDYDVLLPGLSRTLGGTYHSIRSKEFDAALRRALGPRVRTASAALEVSGTEVLLSSGERLKAKAVIDGRGVGPTFPSGYQKFLGQELELERPHGLSRPLLMDATVEQIDGYRFMYALPFSERRVLVEDTIYSDTPEFEVERLRERVNRWVSARGWAIAKVLREERAALPLPLGGKAPQSNRPVIGLAGGFFHATTGYSLPFAAEMAEFICSIPSLDADSLTNALNDRARRHWAGQSFFRLLNRMLFLGAEPSERARVFASFYGHEEPLIARFYAGRLTQADKLRALWRGAPTVPAFKAIAAAFKRV